MAVSLGRIKGSANGGAAVRDGDPGRADKLKTQDDADGLEGQGRANG